MDVASDKELFRLIDFDCWCTEVSEPWFQHYRGIEMWAVSSDDAASPSCAIETDELPHEWWSLESFRNGLIHAYCTDWFKGVSTGSLHIWWETHWNPMSDLSLHASFAFAGTCPQCRWLCLMPPRGYWAIRTQLWGPAPALCSRLSITYIYIYDKIHIHMIIDYRYVCDITCKLLNSKAGAAEHRVQRPTWKTSPAAGSLTKPCPAGKLAPGHFQRSTKVGPVDKPGDLGKAGSGLG